MNILVITREIPPVGGGAGKVALHLSEELARLGHRIFIITMHFGELPIYEERGLITIYRVNCGRKHQDNSYSLEMLRFIIAAYPLAKKIILDYNCRIVHAHAIIPDGFIALKAAKVSGIPTIVTAHGSDVPGHNPDKFKLMHKLIAPLWHRTLDQVKILVTPSNYLASVIQKLHSTKVVSIIPNGIHLNIFSPQIKNDSFLICSRLIKSKNFHLFFEALKEISETQIINIIGDGPVLTELKKLTTEIPQHKIIFHGWLAYGSEQWRYLYETCRYFVFPSERENFPINLLEAQIAGMIILASPIPGNREVLGENAIYFESITVSAIAKTLQQLLCGKFEHTDEMIKKALVRVNENFSWGTIAEKYLRIYESYIAYATSKSE